MSLNVSLWSQKPRKIHMFSECGGGECGVSNYPENCERTRVVLGYFHFFFFLNRNWHLAKLLILLWVVSQCFWQRAGAGESARETASRWRWGGQTSIHWSVRTVFETIKEVCSGEPGLIDPLRLRLWAFTFFYALVYFFSWWLKSVWKQHGLIFFDRDEVYDTMRNSSAESCILCFVF